MLYVTLTLFVGILAYAISGTNFLALLILPWVCLIMGWVYLVIDEITFVLSGIGALIGFQVMAINPNGLLQILCGFELVLLLILGAEIIIYADLKEG